MCILLSRFVCATSLTLFFSLPAPGQTDSAQLSPAEHYNLLLRLTAAQDYAQVVTESQKLIERAPHFDHAYTRLAVAANAAKQLDEAQAFLEAQLVKTPPNPLAYLGLGLVYRERKNIAAEIESYQRCLEELPNYERAFSLMITAWVNLRQPQAAESFLKSVLASQPQNSGAHFGLGFFHYLYARYDLALPEFEAALALNPQIIQAYHYKADLYFRQRRYQDCLQTIRQGIRVAEAAQDEQRQREALALQLRAEVRLGLSDETPGTLQKVRALTQKSADLITEGFCLSQLALLFLSQDDYAKSVYYERAALAVYGQLNDRASIGRCLGNLAELRYKLGDLPGAFEYYRQALGLAVEAKDLTNRSEILTKIGGIQATQRNFKEAAAAFNEALQFAQQLKNANLQVTGLNGLAELYIQLNDLPRALATIQPAVKLSQESSTPALLGRSLNNLGTVYLRSGELQTALQVYQQALAVGESKNSPLTEWQAHTGLALTYEELKQLAQAREQYHRAIEVLERVRAQLGGEEEKAGFFQDKNEAYKQLIALLLAPPRSTTAGRDPTAQRRDEAEAFYYAERARARAFLDLLAEAKINPDQSLTPDLLDRQQALQKQIAQLTAQLLKERAQELAKQDQAKITELETGLSRADAEQRDWQNEVRRRNPHYAALQYPEPVTLAETQRLLDEQTVLLAYSLGETESFLFAVSRRDLLVAQLPAATSIGQRVEKLLAAITDKNRPAADEYRRQAVELSKQLIQPAHRLLAGKRELIIVPDGALHRLPFEALFTSAAAAQGDLRQLPYLIKSFAVSYAPSASVLAGLRNESRTTAPKAFIAYADPTYEQNAETVVASTVRAASAGGRLNLNRLPHSRREAEGIAKLFGRGEADLFLGAAASEENVKLKDRLSQYRLVHFSTHGYVNEARPRLSGLLLSSPPTDRAGQSEDGLLSAYEIFNLKLNAELVVLSACETGLGKEVRGEGLMSLMRAFMYAGTPSVMVSLWQVDDESAADLMIRFYRYWQQGVKQGKATVKVGKAEALRRAQLDAIAQGDFPYYWAPFVLVGSP